MMREKKISKDEARGTVEPRRAQGESGQGLYTHVFIAEFLNSADKKIAEKAIVIHSDNEIAYDFLETVQRVAEERAKEYLDSRSIYTRDIHVRVRHIESEEVQ